MDRAAAPIRRVIYGTSVKEPITYRGRVPVNPQVEAILARPSWSVRSLLPTQGANEKATVSKEKLHHLLKLSALPSPKSPQEEQRMLETLESQIHFVNEVQKVDTTGVEPLVAIRDETAESIQEQTITLEKLQPYLDQEDKVGVNGTVRRRKPSEMITNSGWDPFEMGDGKETRKMGKYFFVRKEKAKDKR